ncbi:hypothetical protein [Gordonia terrae]|uniref:hypothetical protein n=1 Tax=Gordonia terrae TaxID=2055 RepID=UPI0020D09C06|nr:hypothetical protein [Gordonia terrae]
MGRADRGHLPRGPRSYVLAALRRQAGPAGQHPRDRGGAVEHIRIAEIEKGDADASSAIKATTRALFWKNDSADPEWVDTPIYDRALFKAGNTFDGPAIVQQFDSTTIVGIGQKATVDAVGHIIIERSA